MLDTYGRKYVNPMINLGAKIFIKLKMKANHVTILALFLGIATSICVVLDKNILGVCILWLSGYLDAVDGAVARKEGNTTSFGTLMDITFDRMVEVSMILALAIKFSEARLNLLFLTIAILISMTIFLTVGALTEKKGMKSFYYQAGIAERTEGFIMFSLMILIPTYVCLITNIFSAIIIITIFQRLNEARKILK